MRYVLIVCAFVLPACGNPAPGTSVEDAATAGAAAVRAGVDAQRATTLRTDIVTAGEDCPAITRTFRQGTNPSDGAEYWNVSCGAAGDFAVVTGGSDNARVMRCETAKGVTGVDCFTAFEAAR